MLFQHLFFQQVLKSPPSPASLHPVFVLKPVSPVYLPRLNLPRLRKNRSPTAFWHLQNGYHDLWISLDFMTTAISSTLPRLAEAATQPLAALVQPVLIPLAPLYLPSSSLVVSDL